MHIDRNKLLITLALFCALASGPSRAATAPSHLGHAPVDVDSAPTYYKPGSGQNSGEPDVPQGGTIAQHTSLLQVRYEDGMSAPVSRGRYMALALRWAQVFWMARYVGLTP